MSVDLKLEIKHIAIVALSRRSTEIRRFGAPSIQAFRRLTLNHLSASPCLLAPQPYYALTAVAPRLNPAFLIGPVIQRGAVHVCHHPPS